ncbi:MAG: sulfotransferase [Flavobacteriales bacterium]|nr:sulfotransferase [Flavobacteriales bacterium]
MECHTDRQPYQVSDTPHKTDFFVVGVVKGGTTSLYTYLQQHPAIYLPPIKEINHFSQADIHEEEFLPAYAKDVAMDLPSYLDSGMKEMVHIAHVNDPEDYSRLYAPARPDQEKGDISNSYMVCPSAAQAIHRHNPEARIIAVLRNPVRRAWSQYLMNLREAKTHSNSFREELIQDDGLEKKGWGVNHQYLHLGNYHDQLKPYIDLFGKEQCLVLLFEEYTDDLEGTLQTICRFLGVDENFPFQTDLQRNSASLPRHAGLNRWLVNTGIMHGVKRMVPRGLRAKVADLMYTTKDLPQMGEDDKAWLVDHYREEVERLSRLLGRDLGGVWNEFARST